MAHHSQDSGSGARPAAACETPFGLVAEGLARVEAQLVDLCGPGTDGPACAAREAVQAGGKRLRPGLTLLCARAVGEPTDATVDLAVAVEVMHLASLMHDDVVDEAPLRRGGPSVRQLWGNRTAVLAGDYLAARAYGKLADLQDWRYLGILAQVATGMCLAEGTSAGNGAGECTPEACMSLARGKTAGLIAASCQLGAMSAGADEATADVFHTYGLEVGIVFQLTDDLLDLFGDAERLGKAPGRDVLTGQYTLPMVLALQSPQGEVLRGIIEQAQAAADPAAHLTRVAEVVEASGARAAVQEVISRRVEAARETLQGVPGARPDAVASLLCLAKRLPERTQ